VAEEHETDRGPSTGCLTASVKPGNGRGHADAAPATRITSAARNLDPAQMRSAARFSQDLARGPDRAGNAIDDIRFCQAEEVSSTRGMTIARSCDEVTSRVRAAVERL